MLDGGLMVDFDVFKYGLTPRMADDIIRAAPPDKVIHFSGDATPCAGHGTASAFETYCQIFDEFIAHPVTAKDSSWAHVHDLNILSVNREVRQPIKICSLYPMDPHWHCYPLTHFTNGHVRYPRSARISKPRPFRASDEGTQLRYFWSKLVGWLPALGHPAKPKAGTKQMFGRPQVLWKSNPYSISLRTNTVGFTISQVASEFSG
jgi:hypothetical protein